MSWRSIWKSIWESIGKILHMIASLITIFVFFTGIKELGEFGLSTFQPTTNTIFINKLLNMSISIHLCIRWVLLYLYLILSAIAIYYYIKEQSTPKSKDVFTLGLFYLIGFAFFFLVLALHNTTTENPSNIIGIFIFCLVLIISTPLIFRHASKNPVQKFIFVIYSLAINFFAILLVNKRLVSNESGNGFHLIILFILFTLLFSVIVIKREYGSKPSQDNITHPLAIATILRKNVIATIIGIIICIYIISLHTIIPNLYMKFQLAKLRYKFNNNATGLCIWGNAKIRNLPSEKSKAAPYSLSFGETATWIEDSTAFNSTENDSFYKILNPESNEPGWIKKAVFIKKALPAITKKKAKIYRSPNRTTIKNNTIFEPLEFIAIEMIKNNWLKVTGKQKAKSGWIIFDGISIHEKDIDKSIQAIKNFQK